MKNKVYYHLANGGKIKSLLLCSGLWVLNGRYQLQRRKKDGRIFITWPDKKITKDSIEVFYLCDAPCYSDDNHYDQALEMVKEQLKKEEKKKKKK